jgi:DNA mismatch endonuclease (patch repair protein)
MVTPKTRPEFWSEKRGGNVTRDERHRAALEGAGWKVVTVWECQSRSEEELRKLLTLELPPVR